MRRSAVALLVLALGAVPFAVKAAKVSVPAPPSITGIASIRKSSSTFDLRVSFAPPRSNGGASVTSTLVSAGGRTCIASASKRTCTIVNLRRNTRVSVSAKARNSRGWSSSSKPVTYVVGSAAWTAKTTTPSTTAATTTAAATRPWQVVVPTSYSASTPAPLVVLLHGYSATGAIQSSYMGFDALAKQRGFLLVHPDGTSDAMGNQFWNATEACCDFFGSKVDDDGYLMSIVNSVSSSYSVDQKRIFFIGHSNGGFMTYRMACNHSDRIAAIVVLAGAMVNDASKCAPLNPVSVLHVHGTADSTIAYSGGDLFGNKYPGAETSVNRWVASNSCTGSPIESVDSIDLVSTLTGVDTSTRTWSSCGGGTSIALWTINGGSHTPAIASDFSSRLVDFLLAHPKP